MKVMSRIILTISLFISTIIIPFITGVCAQYLCKGAIYRGYVSLNKYVYKMSVDDILVTWSCSFLIWIGIIFFIGVCYIIADGVLEKLEG